jgi:SAM-dependent methyltransferase
MLKAVSIHPITKRLYRQLGNSLGARQRSKKPVPEHYFERVNTILRLHRQHGIPKNGDHILEVGTGWVHWEALICRLFFDVRATLFDVWDNRQFSSFKYFTKQLNTHLDKLDADQAQQARARQLLEQIQRTETFEELYELLGFEYHVDVSGTMASLPDDTFDFVLSANVMEHVQAEVTQQLICNIARVLKPGGYSFHQIDLKDHLHYYARQTSPKEYLRFSDVVWRRWFQNDVQYINRIQLPQWHAMFEQAGLELVEEYLTTADLDELSISDSYKHLDEATLRCATMAVLHERLSQTED